MACHGICGRLPSPKRRVYGDGVRRCTTCSIWLCTDDIRCQCCHQILRSRRHNADQQVYQPPAHTASMDTRAYTGIPDSNIIYDELVALDRAAESQHAAKRAIILAAAHKLGKKYNDNKSIVGARLAKLIATDNRTPDGDVKVYARVSRAWMYDVLPDEYKRGYESSS